VVHWLGLPQELRVEGRERRRFGREQAAEFSLGELTRMGRTKLPKISEWASLSWFITNSKSSSCVKVDRSTMLEIQLCSISSLRKIHIFLFSY
jgi:hypothetical protein